MSTEDQTKVEETVLQTPKAEEPAQEKESKKEEKQTKTCDFCQSEIPVKATRCRYCGSILSKKSTEENEQFSVQREEIQTQLPSGLTEQFTKVTIVIKDEQLKANLKSYMNNNPRFFDKEPQIPADELFTILPNLRQAELGWAQSLQKSPFHYLLKFLEKEYEELAKKFDQMLKEKVITFEALQFVFQRGKKFWGLVDGEFKVGSEVIETSYQRNMFATFFVVTGEVIKSNGERFFSTNHQFVINYFKGVKKIEELAVQPMSDEVMAYLNSRGKKFNEISCGCHYLQYVGKMIYKTPFYTTSWKSDGRIMIDGTSFNKMNPNYREFTNANLGGGGRGLIFHNNQQNNDQSIKAIPEESWYKSWPTVGGFSFSSKKWGEIVIEGCSPVQFDDTAFQRLVLDEEKKALIKALVLHTENAFADIITGKGAGCIFLLHGPPGCGKTLTAEAIAEMLHRPLYSVSVGELGTNTETLETKLRDILEVASVWNSVILIDEADIFLEKRTDNDIKRNAMVGIFLRLLEYHQGILFLTTNRVKRFDDAFHSRISIALKYEELGTVARNKVWKNFFDAAKINGLDENVLCKYELNGRQIRTTIRLAQALAKNEKTTVKMNHVERTISVAAQFQKDLKSYDSPLVQGVVKGVGLTTLVGLGTVGGLFLFKFLNKHI